LFSAASAAPREIDSRRPVRKGAALLRAEPDERQHHARSTEFSTMRAETQAVVDDIRESLALLRRHL